MTNVSQADLHVHFGSTLKSSPILKVAPPPLPRPNTGSAPGRYSFGGGLSRDCAPTHHETNGVAIVVAIVSTASVQLRNPQ